MTTVIGIDPAVRFVYEVVTILVFPTLGFIAWRVTKLYKKSREVARV